MHRQSLLMLVEEYARRWPEEVPVVERFRRFVAGEPRCFERDCWAGHVTGSAWLVNPDRSHVLLTHHKKLERWLQVGGHSDGDPDTLAVAVREAEEETGLTVAPLGYGIFDLDVHEIPARKQDPAHYHFDARFLLEARDEAFLVSAESLELAWVPIPDLRDYSEETSILRMRDKWLASDIAAVC